MPWYKHHPLAVRGAASKIQKAFRAYRKKKAAAKSAPRKALSQGYKGPPNQYRFISETIPVTLDLGVEGEGVSLLAGAVPNMSCVNLPNFQISSIAGGFSQYSALFANYKVDKIETTFIPMWEQTVNPDGAGSGTTQIPNLVVTRINAKYLTNGYTLPTTAAANRIQLGQVVKKTRSLYGSKKWLKLITNKPLVFQDIEDGSGGVNLTTKHSPWIPTLTGADQQYCMNDLLFADTLTNINLPTGVYKYRYFHKVHFRCAFLG